jgi:hypothetical protein
MEAEIGMMYCMLMTAGKCIQRSGRKEMRGRDNLKDLHTDGRIMLK